ncbi:MAG: ABC transporter permease [Candidatus Kapaibacterium sp.]
MNRFSGFVRKEFYHIFRDKRTLLILFGMPIVQVLLFGFAITNEINSAGIAILDNSKDQYSREIMDKMLSSGYFILKEELRNYDDIESAFQKGEVKTVVVFPVNFGNRLINGERPFIELINDATDPNTAKTLSGYFKGIINDYIMDLTPGGNPSLIEIETRMRYNPRLESVYMFVPGLITIILMLVSAMMTSISLTKEKEQGTMELLLASPMRPGLVIASKVIPYALLSFINAVSILAIGWFVFGVPVKGSLILLAFELTIFIITSLSLGIFISSKAPTQQAALMISLVGLMLPTILLSGFIFPVENMPLWLQSISHLIPAKWFIIIVKGIMLKAQGLPDLLIETGILAFMAMFLLFVSIKSYKVRLQ